MSPLPSPRHSPWAPYQAQGTQPMSWVKSSWTEDQERTQAWLLIAAWPGAAHGSNGCPTRKHICHTVPWGPWGPHQTRHLNPQLPRAAWPRTAHSPPTPLGCQAQASPELICLQPGRDTFPHLSAASRLLPPTASLRAHRAPSPHSQGSRLRLRAVQGCLRRGLASPPSPATCPRCLPALHPAQRLRTAWPRSVGRCGHGSGPARVHMHMYQSTVQQQLHHYQHHLHQQHQLQQREH